MHKKEPHNWAGDELHLVLYEIFISQEKGRLTRRDEIFEINIEFKLKKPATNMLSEIKIFQKPVDKIL